MDFNDRQAIIKFCSENLSLLTNEQLQNLKHSLELKIKAYENYKEGS